MKTGTAIALAISVPATIGLIIWGVTANRIIDIADNNMPGGGGEDCGRRVADQASAQRVAEHVDEIASFGPGDNALEFLRTLFRWAWPDCSWSNGVRATVVNGRGQSMEWSRLVAELGSRTIEDVSNDPVLMDFLRAQDGMQGSSGLANDMARGLFA